MKVAVTYEDGKVFQHFGHTEYFKIYDVKDGKVVGSDTARWRVFSRPTKPTL